jgi:DNA (cytosine-5)-methyltransferase 1
MSAPTSIESLRSANARQSSSLRFVDLFAGLGGFHVALSRLGHRCVLASEIQAELAKVYEQNFGIRPLGDIRAVSPADIPAHDILCAGFPCQPFSKAGIQLGADCPEYGDLALRIVEWLYHARPKYFILENVPNLVRHRSGNVWRRLSTDLRQAGYDMRFTILSPHSFGVPQLRDRLYVVGSRSGLDGFEWPTKNAGRTDIRSVLDIRPLDAKPLTKKILAAIDAWSAFTEMYPKDQPKPWFPIWAAEFGATYPFAVATPSAIAAATLREYRGSFGLPLADLRGQALNAAIPPYSRTITPKFPSWKVKFIQLNRELYERNRRWIDPWKNSLDAFEPSFQKLEWNYERGSLSLWDTILQLRGSGIRAKSPSSAPALVAMSSSQVPIVGWERRYMTVKECARLQGLEDLQHLPKTETAAQRALGNAVSVGVIERIATQLLSNASGLNSQLMPRRKRA